MLQESGIKCFKLNCLFLKEKPILCVFAYYSNMWTVFCPDFDYILKTRFQMAPVFCGVAIQFLERCGFAAPNAVQSLKTFDLQQNALHQYEATKLQWLLNGRHFMRAPPAVSTFVLQKQNKQKIINQMQSEHLTSFLVELKNDILVQIKRFINELNILIGSGFVGKARVIKISNSYGILELSTSLTNELRFEVFKFDAF